MRRDRAGRQGPDQGCRGGGRSRARTARTAPPRRRLARPRWLRGHVELFRDRRGSLVPRHAATRRVTLAAPTRTTYVAFLRGINVGRAKQVAMADLREIVEAVGYVGVRTLLRSGNIVFAGPALDAAALARALETAIDARLGMTVRVVVRTAD